jgi:hypothetical protein
MNIKMGMKILICSLLIVSPAMPVHAEKINKKSQQANAIGQVKKDIARQAYISQYAPCRDVAGFMCNDVINTNATDAFFSSPQQALEELNKINESSDLLLWVFAGRFYFKYNEYRGLTDLSGDELPEYLPAMMASLVVRPEEEGNKAFSVEALGLNTLSDQVLDNLRLAYPGKKLLVLFVTESFIVDPGFEIDGQNKQVILNSLSILQKNLFFAQHGLTSSEKQLIRERFHNGYLNELNSLDGSVTQRNNWLAGTVKDLGAIIKNDRQVFDEMPSSARERQYAYSLHNAGYDPSRVSGFEDFKEGGYRYNFNAYYNYKVYLAALGANPNSVVHDGVRCGANYFYQNTRSSVGIVNNNGCQAVNELKLQQHYLEVGKGKVVHQMAATIEQAIYLEIDLAMLGERALLEKLFNARKKLILTMADYGSLDQMRPLYALANTKIAITPDNKGIQIQALSGITAVGVVTRTIPISGVPAYTRAQLLGDVLGTSADAVLKGSGTRATTATVTSARSSVSMAALRTTIATAAIAVFAETSLDIYNATLELRAVGELRELHRVIDQLEPRVSISPRPYYPPVYRPDPVDKEEDDNCEECKEHSKLVCNAWQQVRDKAIQGSMEEAQAKAAVNKVCSSIRNEATLLEMAGKLNGVSYSALSVKAFLRDVNKNHESPLALNKNIASFDGKLLDAWKVVYDARCDGVVDCNENQKCDMATLRKVKQLLNDNAFLADIKTEVEEISGRDALIKIIASNKRAPCNTCESTSASHLKTMAEYLDDVLSFVQNFRSRDGSRLVLGRKDGIKNALYHKVEGGAFLLRVLNSELGVYMNSIDRFEEPYREGEDFAADIRLKNGALIECKSWSDNGISFEMFISGGSGSFIQFTNYLKGIASLDDLSYWFDKDKISGKDIKEKEEVVKRKFRQLFQDKSEDIWDIISEKPAILLELGNISSEEDFKVLLNETNNKLYSFIKVK